VANMLYNGVELPDINEVWTGEVKETYSHVVIHTTSDSTFLVFSDVPFLWETTTGVFTSAGFDSTSRMYDRYELKATEWVLKEGGYGKYQPLVSALVWSNHNINWTDGSLYFAASDPIDPNAPNPLPDLSPDEATKWYLVGQAVRRMLMRQREPVAYLYNGLVCPDINKVWTDKKTQPYVAICAHNTNLSVVDRIFMSSNPILGSGGTTTYSGGNTKYAHLQSDGWGKLYDTPYPDATYAGTIIWANHDIYSSDGMLTISESDPIPVYE